MEDKCNYCGAYISPPAQKTAEDKEWVKGEFAQAKRALLRLAPDGESEAAEEIYSILESFKNRIIKGK